MPLRKALFPSVCVLAAIASQSCVEYLPPDNPPPPPGPTYAAPQEAPPPPPQPPAQPAYYPAQPTEAPPQPPSQPSPNTALDNLLAPIALYPDPLIALILPASTVPGDVTSASNYLVQYGDQSQINNQPWDPSVRALAHYPTVIEWMASNMDWTQALGSAFSSDPNGVMDAVQRLRARARATGALATTPQAQVMDEDGDIEIVPAQDNVIYIPVYDPEVVYSGNPYYGYSGAFINFGEPCPAGIWLSYSFDWRSHRVWAGDRERDGWRRSHSGGGGPPPGAHTWHAPTGARAPLPPARYRSNNVPMPHPMPGAPNPPPDRSRRPVTNNVQPPAQGGSHNYPAPQDRPRLNSPQQSSPANPQRPQQSQAPQQGSPSRVVLPPTNHGESAPVQRQNAQAPVEQHGGQPAPSRPERYETPTAPQHGMPEHAAQPAREPRPQAAPARSAPPPPPPPASNSSSQNPNGKQN